MIEEQEFFQEKSSRSQCIPGINSKEYDFSEFEKISNEKIAFDYRKKQRKSKNKDSKTKEFVKNNELDPEKMINIASQIGIDSLRYLDYFITVGDIKRMSRELIEDSKYRDLVRNYFDMDAQISSNPQRKHDREFQKKFSEISESIKTMTSEKFDHIPDSREKLMVYNAEYTIFLYSKFLMEISG